MSDKDVFEEELSILNAAKAHLSKGKQPDSRQFERLVRHYEKLLKTSMKLSRISDIQGRTLKDREQELEEAQADLQHLEQLRRQLISDISHELRTPITSVQGYIKAFLDDVIRPDPEYLSMIYQKLLTINQLIQDLFQLSTLKANQLHFHFRPMTARKWFDTLRDKYALEAARREIALSADPVIHGEDGTGFGAEPVQLIIDSVRMEQVVSNLVDNALKYTPKGGTVRLYARIADKLPEPAEGFKPFKPLGHTLWFILHVEDTGIGIDGSELPLIFERFYRAQGTRSGTVDGTGLGLAISKEIVAQHGGGIDAQSEPGRGSRFRVILPAHRSQNPS